MKTLFAACLIKPRINSSGNTYLLTDMLPAIPRIEASADGKATLSTLAARSHITRSLRENQDVNSEKIDFMSHN